jgi:Terminase large subunit, T4likevirus-type, N-terminal
VWCDTHRRTPPRAPDPISVPTPDILTFARTQLDFHPDPLQQQLLLSTSDRAIVNCSRQWGKSTLAAVKAVHHAVTRPSTLTIIAAPTEKQSAELLLKARAFLRHLNTPVTGDRAHRRALLLPNGSRLVAIPGTEATLRGFSAVSLLIVDEASRVPDETYYALKPMLATSAGDLWLLSTPYGQRGFFYEEWTHGAEDWTRLTVPAEECPRISEQFLARERKDLSETWFQQEYMCQFTTNGSQMFSTDSIESALTNDTPMRFD